MRCFLAIDLPKDIQTKLEEVSTRLRRAHIRASWVKPENMHMTLRFLGELQPESVEKLGMLLDTPLAQSRKFFIRVKEIGAFPNLKKPAVVWVGVQTQEDTLFTIQKLTETAAQEVGCAKEKEKFHPHVTLARVRDPRKTSELLPFLLKEKDIDAGEFQVKEVVLFESRLTPQGPIYSKIKIFPLKGDE